MGLLLWLAVPAFAKDKEKIKRLTPTVRGSSGLFSLYVADTYRVGELSLAFHGIQFNREPGDIDITLFPASFTLGLHDRLEAFVSWEAHKRVNADAIMVNKLSPRGTISPARLANGILAYFNDTPFMDVGFGNGTGDLWTGIKFNLLSELRNNPLGLALQPIARVFLTDRREHLLRGLTSGATDAGLDIIVSKSLGVGTMVTGNLGFLSGQDLKGIKRQERLQWGVGLEAPLGTQKAYAILEVISSTFFGSGGPGEANPVSPLDLHAGLRTFPTPWLSIGGAYVLGLRSLNENRFGVPATGRQGWIVQIAFQHKTNRPPTIECSLDKGTITEGESASIKIRVLDPDDDVLSIIWRAPGSKIYQLQGSARFDSTGLKPGKYNIVGEVSDGEHKAACIVGITVEERKSSLP